MGELSDRRRLFAVIPAAGQSRRMGRAKLLLPLGGATVIGRLLQTLRHPAIAATVVVLRGDDVDLQREVLRWGAIACQPAVDPPDMRASVEQGLDFLRRTFAPLPHEGWLLIPADHPVLVPTVLEKLLSQWAEVCGAAVESGVTTPPFPEGPSATDVASPAPHLTSGEGEHVNLSGKEWGPILVPTFHGKRGHPTFLSWKLADDVPRIPRDQGLNWLVRQHAALVRECPVDDPSIITDLDTPEDYARLLRSTGDTSA